MPRNSKISVDCSVDGCGRSAARFRIRETANLHCAVVALLGPCDVCVGRPTSTDHLCRLTAVRCPSGRTRSRDRDGATTCGTGRAPTGWDGSQRELISRSNSPIQAGRAWVAPGSNPSSRTSATGPGSRTRGFVRCGTADFSRRTRQLFGCRRCCGVFLLVDERCASQSPKSRRVRRAIN